MQLLTVRSANNNLRRLALKDGRRPRVIPAGTLVHFPAPGHDKPLTGEEEQFIAEYVRGRVLVEPTEENQRVVADALKESPDELFWVVATPNGGFRIAFPPKPQAD